MLWRTTLAEWRAWMICGGQSPDTVRLRTCQMRGFALDHPGGPKQPPEVLIDWMSSHPAWTVETRRSYRSALRSFYGWMVSTGRTGSNPAAALPSIRASIPAPRPTPEDVLAVALSTADRRNQLMVLLAARQGLRRAEIAKVHSDDLTVDISGWPLLRVHGKGRKERVVPLCDDVTRRLRELPPGWAFPGRTDGHLSPDTVGEIIGDLLPGEWTAHTLRHRFATAAYRGSGDLLSVQQLLGHSRPETTQRYVAVEPDKLRAAMQWAA